jgi:hypothetical protein
MSTLMYSISMFDHVHKKSEIDQNLVVICQRRNRPPIDYQFLFEGFIE